MRGLTKREKTLLIILVVFAAASLFIAYAIMPAISARSTERSELSALEDKLVEQQTLYTTYSNNEAALTAANAKSVELYGQLYSNKTYDTGLLLSNMLSKHSLTPLDMTIGGRSRSALMDYVDDEGNKVTVDTGYAFCREVTVRFTGARTDANSFINELCSFDTRYVLHGVDITYTDERTDYTVQLTLYEFDESAATTADAE